MQISDAFYRIGDFFGGRHQQKHFWNNRLNMDLSQGKVYINTDVPYKVYNSIPQFRIPINKLAAMFANGVPMIQMPDGSIKELPAKWKKLFDKPNLMQGQNSFMETYMKQLKVYGNQYIRKNQATRLAPPSSLMCISPARMQPVLTGKFFDQVTIDGIVKNYEYQENGTTKYFTVDEILWSKIDDLDNPLIGASPLLGMQFPISNTELAYKYLNCISGKKGYLGILSYEPKRDPSGELPQTPEDRKEMERLYKENAGVDDNQMQTLITRTKTTYTPTTYPTGQLLLLEQIDANFLTILAELGVNSNLFKDSTYENLKQGLLSTHNDAVQPVADSFSQQLGEFCGINKDTGGVLILDYSHLPYLQEDKVVEANTFSTVSNALNALVTSTIITAAEAKIRLVNQFGEFKAA